MYLGVVLKVRAHAHDASDKPRTNASAAKRANINHSSGPTYYKANRSLESEYWGHANKVQVITGGRMISSCQFMTVNRIRERESHTKISPKRTTGSLCRGPKLSR
jgi:hypothetical protein